MAHKWLVAAVLCALTAGVMCSDGEKVSEHIKVLTTADFDDAVADGGVYFIKVGACARACTGCGWRASWCVGLR